MDVENTTPVSIYRHETFIKGHEAIDITEKNQLTIQNEWAKNNVLLLFPFSSPPIVPYIMDDGTPDYDINTICSLFVVRKKENENENEIEAYWVHVDNNYVKKPPSMDHFLYKLNVIFLKARGTVLGDNEKKKKSILIPLQINETRVKPVPNRMGSPKQRSFFTFDKMLDFIEHLSSSPDNLTSVPPEPPYDQWTPLILYKSLLNYNVNEGFYDIVIVSPIGSKLVPLGKIPDLYLIEPSYENDSFFPLYLHTPEYIIGIYRHSDGWTRKYKNEPTGKAIKDVRLDKWKAGQNAYDIHFLMAFILEYLRERFSPYKFVKDLKSTLQWDNDHEKLGIYYNRTLKILKSRVLAIKYALEDASQGGIDEMAVETHPNDDIIKKAEILLLDAFNELKTQQLITGTLRETETDENGEEKGGEIDIVIDYLNQSPENDKQVAERLELIRKQNKW